MKTEKEKMILGEIYIPTDPVVLKRCVRSCSSWRKSCKDYKKIK